MSGRRPLVLRCADSLSRSLASNSTERVVVCISETVIIKILVSVLCLGIAGLGASLLLQRKLPEYSSDERFTAWLTAIAPFCYGGYYTLSAAGIGLIILIRLIMIIKRDRRMIIRCNLPVVSLFLLVLSYGLTVLWASNQGMAVFGFARRLPIFLYLMLLMQIPSDHRDTAVVLLPFSGTLMVWMALILQYVPGFAGSQLVDGRLSGFFEYANTFALFLILCIIVLILQWHSRPALISVIALITMITGIFFSGSRIGLFLLLLTLSALILMLRDRHLILQTVFSLLLAILFSYLASELSFIAEAQRYTTTGTDHGSLWVRFLYYKDAIPQILTHPFGCGWWGYATTRKLFQHGVYQVSHVHNDLLQLFLDIGWIPTILFAATCIQSFFSHSTSRMAKTMLLLICIYSMTEFHLEYLSIWFLLISCFALQTGHTCVLEVKRLQFPCMIFSLLCAVSLWLGTGEASSIAGMPEISVKITPFYTQALKKQLRSSDNTSQQRSLAERILKYDQYYALAWTTLADQAWDSNELVLAIQYQKEAIACDRYNLDIYLSYFDRLYSMMEYCRASGDNSGEALCISELTDIPLLLQAVEADTDPLAWEIEHQPTLELPEEYQEKLALLQ